MMDTPSKPRGGAAAMLTLFSVVVFAIGLGLDFAFNSGRAFWIGAEQGARAVIAASAIVALTLIARLLRLALARDRGDVHGRD